MNEPAVPRMQYPINLETYTVEDGTLVGNNPVILMMKPDSIVVQEIKVIPAKAKIMDMVAIRHITGPELRTTLILLCEDGSLRIYMANMDQTGTTSTISPQEYYYIFRIQ